MKKAIGLAAALTLTLTACAATEKDAEYKNINDLGAAYEQAIGNGTECSESQRDIAKNGWDQIGCGSTAIAMVFTSDAKREEVKEKNPLESGELWVQGKNWLIEADQYDAEKAHAEMGGELLRP